MFFKEFEVPYFYTRLGFKSTHPNIPVLQPCTQPAPSYKNTDNAAACTPTLRMAQGSCPHGSSHTG